MGKATIEHGEGVLSWELNLPIISNRGLPWSSPANAFTLRIKSTILIEM